MKITFKRGLSGVCIHAAKVTLTQGRIVYHRTPNSPGDEITLKDESLTIEDDAGEPCSAVASLLHRPVSLMPKPRAPFAAAGLMPLADSAAWDAPLPLWLVIPAFIFAPAFFFLATVKASDAFAARKLPKRRKESKHDGEGSILPALVTALSVIALLLAVTGIYSVGDDAWKQHPTGEDLKEGMKAGGLCLLCAGIAYLAGRNDERAAKREERRRYKLPPQL